MLTLGRRIGAATDAATAWAGESWPRRLVLVLAVALVALLPGISGLPVTDRDEARFAQATKQMLETGDLIDIRLQDEPRWKKPAGIYWLQAGSATMLGDGAESDIWAFRVPSFLAIVLAAFLTGWAARPIAGPQPAALAGLMTAVILLVAVEANIAKTDATLMACAVAVMGALVRLLPFDNPDTRRDALIFWGALGVSILIKGPIVPAIAALAIIWYGFARKWPSWRRFHLHIGLPLLLLIIAPWLIAIAIVSGGAFFTESVGEDMLGKVAAGQEAHGAPPGYYLLATLGTFWPWAAFLPMVLPWAWRTRRATLLRVLAGWVVPFWLVLEIVPTKLPHYVLPLYPALAVVIAAWVLGPARQTVWPGWQRRLSAVLLALPVVVGFVGAIGLPLYVEGEFVWPAAVLAVVGAAFGAIAVRMALVGNPMAQIGASIGAAACLYPALLAFALPSLDTAFLSPRLAAETAKWRSCASGPAETVGYREPSFVFLTETGLGMPTPEEAAAHLRDDTGTMVWIEERFRPALDAHLTDGPDLVTRSDVTGFNYNRGKMTRILLLTRDDARWEPCIAARD